MKEQLKPVREIWEIHWITKTLMDQKFYLLYVPDFRFPNF